MIKEFLKNYRLRYFISGTAYFITIEIAILLFAFTVSSILIIPYQYLLILLIIPLFFIRIPGLKNLAHRIEDDYPSMKNLLVIAYDLETGNFEREGYSEELINKSIIKAKEALARTMPGPRFRIARPVWIGGLCAGVLFLFTLLYFPDRMFYNLHPELTLGLIPEGGTFVKDSVVTFQISADGNLIPDHGSFVYKGQEKNKIKVAMTDGKGKVSLPITADGKISFIALRNRTPEYSVKIKRKSVIDSIITVARFPAYTHLPEVRTKDHSITVIPKSAVAILTFVTPRQGIRFFIHGKEFEEMSNNAFEFTVSNDLTVGIATEGGLKDSILFTCLKDLAPSVVIFQPGQDVNLPRSMAMNLGIRLTDDFQVVRANLHYRIKKRAAILSLPSFKPSYDETIEYNWDLSKLNISPGDTIEYWISALDDIQEGRSQCYKILFPTMAQIYDEVTSRQENLQSRISDLSKATDEKVKKIEEIDESFLKKGKLDWAEIDELKKISRDNLQVKEKIKEWQNQWKDLTDRLANAKVIKPEVISKLEEIAKLISEIAPEQFESAIERMKELADKNPEQFEKQLDQLLQDQELLKESLDRTIELLKRFQQEEYLRRLKEMAEELHQQETELQDKIKHKTEDALSLSHGVQKGVKGLKMGLKNPPEGIDIKDKLQAIEETADSLQLENLAGRQTGEISNKDWKKAKLTAQSLSEHLDQIKNDLKGMYQQTIARRKKEIKKRIERRIAQLVKISKDQEKVISGNVEPLNYEKIIKKNVQAIAESIIADRKVSLHIPVSAALLMARALNNIDQAIRNHASGSSRYAEQPARKGMADLNQAANLLFAALNDLMGSGSPSGLDAFQQQLSSMAQQQMTISQALAKLLPIPANGMSAKLRNEIRKLAEKQQALRRAVEEHAGTSELARNIAKEMKDIESSLFHYRIDRKLIERQQKLITRLLNADRSIRKDKFEKRRISEVGEDIARKSPRSFIGERPDLLREMIMKELRRAHPSDYQHYIRLYYQILLGER